MKSCISTFADAVRLHISHKSSHESYLFRTQIQVTGEVNNMKLEVLRERRPPWPRQIITPILPTVKMLSLGGERLPPAPPPTKKKKSLGSLPAPRSGYATIIIVFFAHLNLLILEYPDHHQNLISSSLYYLGPRPKISSQSVHNFLSNVVHKQTNQRHQKHNLLCQGGNYEIKD